MESRAFLRTSLRSFPPPSPCSPSILKHLSRPTASPQCPFSSSPILHSPSLIKYPLYRSKSISTTTSPIYIYHNNLPPWQRLLPPTISRKRSHTTPHPLQKQHYTC